MVQVSNAIFEKILKEPEIDSDDYTLENTFYEQRLAFKDNVEPKPGVLSVIRY
jgi:hypothetical protein